MCSSRWYRAKCPPQEQAETPRQNDWLWAVRVLSVCTDWWHHLRSSWCQLPLLDNNHPGVNRSQSYSWEKWQSAVVSVWNVLYRHLVYTLVLQAELLLGKTVEPLGGRALLRNVGDGWQALMFDSPTPACPGNPHTSLSCSHVFSTMADLVPS